VIKINKLAFTLSEVLITLGIIGVVAAMTIPTLISNYQKTQYVTGLKKAYTEFNQILLQMAADNGCVNDLKCTGLFAEGTTHQTLGDEIVKHFKVVKNCGINSGLGCWSSLVNINYDGTSTTDINYDARTDYYKFITADGMSIVIYNWANNCGIDWSTGVLGKMSQVCGAIAVDVNGLKKPNYWGRDIFWIYLTNGKGASLYPFGGIDDNQVGTNKWWNYNNRNGCSASDNLGWYCTGRVMEQGWVMDY